MNFERELRELENQRRDELEQIEREWPHELAELDRELAAQQRVFESTSDAYAEAASDVNPPGIRVLVEGTAPGAPEPHYIIFKILAALLAGSLLGLGWVLVRALPRVLDAKELN